jgi:hypothetical protein
MEYISIDYKVDVIKPLINVLTTYPIWSITVKQFKIVF